MKFKNILSKIIKPLSSKNNKIESDDCYCYSNIVWNDPKNLIILISFTKEYFDQIIEIQDAMDNILSLNGKTVFSSYDEEVIKRDENGHDIKNLIVHKKYYMLIGGSPVAWRKLYENIHNLGNDVLNRITDEIYNNCDSKDFSPLIDDGVLNKFNNSNIQYDTVIKTKNGCDYTNPEVLLKRLPSGFTGKDILKFIKVSIPNNMYPTSAFSEISTILYCCSNNNSFKNHDLYPLYAALIKNPTMEKLEMLLEPLYKQPDDDSIPGDVSDESLDEIFREHYERFSAITDDSIYYEDIDEELADDEESENMRAEDKSDEY